MADSNLSTSISAIRTKILNDAPTATVDELVSLARAAKSIGLTEDTTIETAINSRANTLSSNASTNDMVKLSNAIKQLRNTTAGAVSPSTTSDDIVEGTSNLYYTDAKVQTKLGDVSGHIIPDTDVTYDLGSTTQRFRDLYLSGNSITLGSVEISDNNGSLEVTPVGGGGSTEAFATETYVTTQVNNLVDAAPGALDTLNELAAALGDDANFSTTVTNSLATKADTSSLATVATSGDYNDLINTPSGGGGNVVEYTSTSSASVNDVVMLNTNGTVTPVEPTNYPVNTQIALSTIGSAHGDNSPHNGLGMIAHKPTDRNSGMVVYRDKNNENHTISSFAASGGSFSISATATVSNTSENMKLYPFFDPFDDTKVLLLYTRSSNARCQIVDTAANGSITINSEIDLGQLGSTANKHFEIDMVNSTSGDVKIICSVPGYVTQLTWDGTNITAGTPIATTNNGYHRFSLGQDGLFAMISGTSLRAGKVDWTAGTVTEGISLSVTDGGEQAYAVSESGKIAYAFYDSNIGQMKISTFSINSSTYACTLLHTTQSIQNNYNSGTPRPHDLMFAPGGETFGFSWYGVERQTASSSDNRALIGTVASNGTITFPGAASTNAGNTYTFFPAGQNGTEFRFLAASEWSNSMSQKGLVGFYSLQFNNYNPISQLRLLDFPYSESNLDVSKIHGLAASSGTTIDVTLENGIHTGLSGLTVGSKYYVLENGTLSASPDSNNAKIGLAITSTSIALDFTDELTAASLSTYATKSYVDTSVANLIDSAPATLDTLNELADALGDDANFATTVTNSIANITNVVALTHTGTLSVYTGTKRWYAPKDITISKIKARVDTAPTGAGVVVQINKTSSGVTTNQQLTVADGTTLISDTSPTISSMSEDDFLTVDIVSVGTTVAGENLTVEITYK